MQGLTDEPLNEEGMRQAQLTAGLVKDVSFDAVYSSPLQRARVTGAMVGRVPVEDVLVDERLIETDFGRYEQRPYNQLGIKMSLYWALPELFPAPDSVETIDSMVKRAGSFLKELESKEYDNVLIAAHGGILRAINGYLLDCKNGIKWRPKMHNCEVRIYESMNGAHKLIGKEKVK